MTNKIKKVLVSGYDLKFWNALQKELELTGLFEFKQDVTIGNYNHDDKKALELIRWADIIIAEWTLNNAVFLAKHKSDHQKLIMRFHAQERLTEYPKQINYDRVDAVIFVGPHVQQEAINKFNIPREKCHLIGNFIDVDKFSLPKMGAEFNIGMIGIVPKLKRLDIAFEVLEELVKFNPNYRLHIKGQSPMSYPWLWKREQEKEYYHKLYSHINSSKLRNYVVFDPSGNDVNHWLQKIGCLLSPSDFESFHVAVAEGAASAALPLVWKREGADEIFSSFPLVENAKQAAKYINILRMSNVRDRIVEQTQNLISNNYNKNIISDKFVDVLMSTRTLDKSEVSLADFKNIVIVYSITNFETFHRKEMLTAFANELGKDTYLLIVEPGSHYQTLLNNKIDTHNNLDCFSRAEVISLGNNIGKIKALYGNIPAEVACDSVLRNITEHKNAIMYFIQKNFGGNIAIYHWLYKPEQIKYVGDEQKYFYEVYDEYTMDFATGQVNQEVLELEKKVLRDASHVFYTSKPLYERKKFYNDKATIISNGVVFDLFNKYRVRGLSDAENKRKSIGYLGNLSNFFNWPLVYELCKERFDLDFFFHGQLELKNDVDKEFFKKVDLLPNTYFSGRVTREQGAAAINCYDALIIPFVINDAMHAVNPLKLWEYFATGIPVISSPMDAINISEPILYVAETLEDWLEKLNMCLLEERNDRLSNERIEMAKAVSWDFLASLYKQALVKEIN